MSSKKHKPRVDPVEVYCRIRPLNENENEKCVKILDDANLMLQIPECSATYRSGQAKQLVYSFTQIFDEVVSQKQLYDQIGFPIVQDCLNGKNGLLFTYGVTGSGKTYTMIGNPQDPGLLQRCLDTIFNSIAYRQARKYTFKPDKMNSFEIQTEAEALLEKQKKEILPQSKTPMKNRARADTEKMADKNCKLADINEHHIYGVFISCIEIYNNYIYDLFDDQVSESSRRIDNKESKLLKEDSKGCMYIKDSVEIEVKSTEEALELMHRAQKKRVVACTDLNSESSRSHSIFTIRIVQSSYDHNVDDYNPNKPKPIVHVSQLSLVDLAGSERTKRTKNTGSRLKEAGNINSSLMALRNCMETLRENVLSGARKMVPYRDSKLTLLFKNFFEGNGKIKMILCINPTPQEFDETINVFKFSDLVKDILIPIGNDVKCTKEITADMDFLNIINTLQSKNVFSNECFPAFELYTPYDNTTINNVVDYLEEHNQKQTTVIKEFSHLYHQLFIKMREILDENERLKEENFDLKYRLDTRDRHDNRLESKIKALERVINSNSTPSLINTNSNKENLMNTEKREIANKINTNKDFDSGIATNTTPTSSSYRPSSRNGGSGSTPKVYSSTVPPLPQTFTTSKVLQATAAYNSHIQHQNYRLVSKSPIRTPQKQDGVPVGNRRAQRRSKSADTWLNHKPANTIKTDTVLQPKMPFKRSVSRVELDDAKKATKYVLTHQQQDSDGEIVTNLIKGDILKSPSGGANVIFTDIETLRCRSQERGKPSRKRISEDVIDDPITLEERCSMGIEGHGKQNANSYLSKIPFCCNYANIQIPIKDLKY